MALLFFSCDEDNPVASLNNKIPLNWAVVGSDCYFTDENNMCEGYSGSLGNAHQYESLEMVGTGDTYNIELCNSVQPPIIEFDDNIDYSYFSDSDFCLSTNYFDVGDEGFSNEWIWSVFDDNGALVGGFCYEWNWDYNYPNTCYILNDFNFVQYK